MLSFCERHWGDLLALYLIHFGVVVIWAAHGDTDISHVGESFILLGAGLLRFNVMGKEQGVTK